MSTAEESKQFYITTPIYYVNDKPHIGHAYTTLACDIIARFMRLDGYDVKFLTGTDEHGQKIQQSAEKAGVSPQEFTDRVSQNFRDLVAAMDFSADRFIRTTEPEHKAAVQALWNKLVAEGQIYLGAYEGWYSVRDEAYYTESELVDGKAPTGADVEWVVKEPSYFFKLSEWGDRLLELYESNPDFIAPKARRNEVISFVKGGLKDLSVSRTTFNWGVGVPGDDDHIMYVWIDALTNYISALGYPETGDGGGDFARFWPADLHVVGKDILRFHAVYWPAFLLAAGLEPPKRIYAHGWWTNNGEKISKSVGNVIDPYELVGSYGLDPTRYFLAAEIPFGNDGDFSRPAFVARVNAALSNELGNLCQRTATMAHKNCDGAVPVPQAPLLPEDEALLAAARGALPALRPLVAEQQALHLACEALLEVVRAANKYIDVQEPWTLRKTDPARMATVLYTILETLRVLGILYQPLVPASANAMLDQLTAPADARTFAHLGAEHALVPGTPFPGKPEPVFPRLEAEGAGPKTAGDVAAEKEAKKEKKQQAKQQQKKKGGDGGGDQQSELSRLEMRTGKILEVARHPEAEKLYVEKIDLGEPGGPRTIVSGLVPHLREEELLGKEVIVLANLKPRTMVGIESAGMLLCANDANDPDKVVPIMPPAGTPVGELVTFKGHPGEPMAPGNRVTKAWGKVADEMVVDNEGRATFGGVPFMTSKGPVTSSLKGPIG